MKTPPAMAAIMTMPTTTPAAMAATLGPDFFAWLGASDDTAGAVVTMVVAATTEIRLVTNSEVEILPGALLAVFDGVEVGVDVDELVGAGASSGSTAYKASLYTFQTFFKPPPVVELALYFTEGIWNPHISDSCFLQTQGKERCILRRQVWLPNLAKDHHTNIVLQHRVAL